MRLHSARRLKRSAGRRPALLPCCPVLAPPSGQHWQLRVVASFLPVLIASAPARAEALSFLVYIVVSTSTIESRAGAFDGRIHRSARI